jgi:TonB family protein
MARRELNFALALGASVALHGVLLSATAPLWGPWLISAPKHKPADEVTVALQDPDLKNPPQTPEEFKMGEASGHGVGSNSSKGDQLLSAREADEDQALLSRDPGSAGRLAHPRIIDGPPGENGRGGQEGGSIAQQSAAGATPIAPPAAPAVVEVVPMPPPAVKIDAQKNPDATVAANADAPVDPPKVAAIITPATPKESAPAVASSNAAQPVRPRTGDGRAPGVDLRQADPAQKSDSESDPFARIGSLVFHDGILEVQKGRKVKTTRPRVLLPGEVDLATRGGATVVLNIAIDSSGKVTSAQVLHSSGSNDIDQPCRVAVYDWWFEPSRDKQGHPVADVLTFTIKFI